ncbi:MAG TPA: ABC transporter substrate-binding protein [Candidatus Dormibacteraeota bacterium]|jgi:branched-chain amino acid transport system substrate-binding protein|nr:ABC transporter substrate-binding protein [Candidatus Dormibacteraeota bacterium]
MKKVPSAWMATTAFLACVLFGGYVRSSIPEEQAGTNGTILVGVSNAQSGPSASLGQNLLRGSKAYWETVNQKGGIFGRKIVLLVKDDKYEPDPAVQNTNDLIEKDEVFFLFDYVGTPTLTRVLPLLKYYEGKKIVNVAPFTGADPQRKPPYDKYVFNIRASYREETRALVRYLYAKGYRRIGYFGQADAYGKSGEIGVRDALAELGLTPVETVSYRRNQPFESDMTAQVSILRQAGVDAVVAVGVYGACGAFIRDARMQGWNVPVANVSFVGAEVMLEKLRDVSRKSGRNFTENLINSQVVPSPEDTRYPLVADFRAHVPPENVGFITLEGWLNAVVVTEALHRAGSTASREDFIHAMESLKGWDPGLGVPLEFSASNHQGLHRVWLTRTKDGHWVPEEAPQEAK